VVLSLLLGLHPAELSARELVALVRGFGVTEPTLRVALTRMVGAGDLVREDSTYRLSDRLLARQSEQDAELDPPQVPWDGSWETAVVIASGRSAEDRAGLREALSGLRLGEVREGVWMRPANLARPRPRLDDVEWLLAAPDGDASAWARRAWDLATWARTASDLIARLGDAGDRGRQLAAAAAAVRHLRTDPLLPIDLWPSGWPAQPLRDAYAHYAAGLKAGEPTHSLRRSTAAS